MVTISSESTTHQHIVAILLGYLKSKKLSAPARVLDLGCGDGKLISLILNARDLIAPDIEIEIFGLDVHDHGVQPRTFFRKAQLRLESNHPNIAWSEHVFLVGSKDEWPFKIRSFDAIITNQVLEHVHDKESFFLRIKSFLKPGGININVAPLRHVIWEGHIKMPIAHWFRSYAALFNCVLFFNSVLGKYKRFRKANQQFNWSAERYAHQLADYVYFWTCYPTQSEILDVARRAGLRANFCFSTDYFLAKARRTFLKQKTTDYLYNFERKKNCFSFSVLLLRYISSVTLICENTCLYDPDPRPNH